MNKSELTIVILNYNTKNLLKKCLDSLKESRGIKKYEIIVVDNGSDDGSGEFITKKYPWVRLLDNKKNLGFAAGNNTALKKIESRFTLLLNPDTVIFPNTIERVLNYVKEHRDVGAATCRVELPNGKLDYSCHRGFPTPWNSFCYFSGLSAIFPKLKFFSGYTATYKDLNKVHEVDALTGAFVLVRTHAGRDVGWLDEEYFWNGEDLDFCFKIKKKGWKIIYIPDVKIIHFKGSASGLRSSGIGKTDKTSTIKAALSSTQVMKIFYKKHLEERYPFFVNWTVYIGINLMEFLRLVKTSI